MVARHRLRVSVLVCMLLVVPVSCDGGGSSRQPGELGQGAAAPAETSTRERDGSASRTGGARAVSVRAVALMDGARHRHPQPDPVWGRWQTWWSVGAERRPSRGTAAVGDRGVVRTMDDPAAPGDPQSPAGPLDPQHRHRCSTRLAGDVLGIDAAGAQTLLWLSDERGPSAGPGPFTEYYDVVLGDRSPGGGWSNSPSVVGAGSSGSLSLR